MALGQEAGSQYIEGSENQSEISDLILGNGRALRDSEGGQDNRTNSHPRPTALPFSRKSPK